MCLGPRFALAAIPSPPCKTLARSVAISPNIFGRTTTSKSSGSLISHIVKASMYAASVSMSGFCSEISLKIPLNNLHPRVTLDLSTQVTDWDTPIFLWRCRAKSNAKLMTRSLPLRDIGLGSHSTSPSSPGNSSITIGSSFSPLAFCSILRRRE